MTIHGHRIHFRRLRHVALDEHERAYLLACIQATDQVGAHVDVTRLKEKLS